MRNITFHNAFGAEVVWQLIQDSADEGCQPLEIGEMAPAAEELAGECSESVFAGIEASFSVVPS